MVRPISSIQLYWDLKSSFFFLGTTNFCESILLSNEDTWKKALQASFGYVTNNTHLNGHERLDVCCRLLHKCDAQKRVELQSSNTEWNVRHCECVHTFRACLNNLNTSTSNELAFIHSLNATKCYAKDHPIVKCAVSEVFSEEIAQFFQIMDSNIRERFLRRCSNYELDRTQPQRIQFFDLQFSFRGMTDIASKCCLRFVLISFDNTRQKTETFLICTNNDENNNKKTTEMHIYIAVFCMHASIR